MQRETFAGSMGLDRAGMALLTTFPPQFGHTLKRTWSAQSAHQVHSFEQIRAS
jgi:hypothetical protein